MPSPVHSFATIFIAIYLMQILLRLCNQYYTGHHALQRATTFTLSLTFFCNVNFCLAIPVYLMIGSTLSVSYGFTPRGWPTYYEYLFRIIRLYLATCLSREIVEWQGGETAYSRISTVEKFDLKFDFYGLF